MDHSDSGTREIDGPQEEHGFEAQNETTPVEDAQTQPDIFDWLSGGRLNPRKLRY